MVWRRAARGFHGLLTLPAALALCIAIASSAAYSAQADDAAASGDCQLSIDFRHANQGYVLVRHEKTENALKLRIAKGEYALTYDLAADGEYAAFPLTLGDGFYTLQVFQRIFSMEYAPVASYDISVIIEDDNLPFLHPNQYVWYTPESKAAAKAARLDEGLSTNTENLGAVRAYFETKDYPAVERMAAPLENDRETRFAGFAENHRHRPLAPAD